MKRTCRAGPKTSWALKALAITAQRAFDNSRPGGLTVLAGAPIIEKRMVEQDIADLAAAGVTLLGEVGLGSVKAGCEAQQMMAWARKHGIRSTIHTGGPSVSGSGLIDKDVVLDAGADTIGHSNGGHTNGGHIHGCHSNRGHKSWPEAHGYELRKKSSRAIEIVRNGNERMAIAAARSAMALKCLHRVILGTDGPTG